MSFLLVAAASLAASALTLYSGFGLGTLLLPVFALFFPVEVAVAVTAVVHAANNILKVAVVGRHADRDLLVRFGVPAVVAAFVGAAALGYVSGFEPLIRYSLGSRTAVVTPVKLLMGGLMLVFALFELLPALRGLRVDRRYLLFGGVLSGFFGGLSGHQGALRSAFLTKVGVSTEAFVGTNAAIGFMVDAARIATYAISFLLAPTAAAIAPGQWPLIATGIAAASAGVFVGMRFLHKVTMTAVQAIAGGLMAAIALALGAGIL